MTSHRHGAALIMAIVILAGLLMLGLPFLFSQSASLTGTRSFAFQQIASVGRSTAEDLAIGAASDIVTRSILVRGAQQEATNPLDISFSFKSTQEPTRFFIDLSAEGHHWNPSEPRNRATIGFTIEDEYGKININHLSVKAWGRLLEACKIADWDDGDGQGKDEDNFGQLAYALATARFDQNICPEGYLSRIEQLLEVTPQPPGVRWPLTRAELAQLRPHLTVSTLGQGRNGIIDLGTWFNRPGAQNATQPSQLDTVQPSRLLAFPTARELFSSGTVLVADPKQQRGANQFPHKYWFGMSESMEINDARKWNPTKPQVIQNQFVAVGIAAPPAVNVTTTNKPVREALWQVNEVASSSGHTLAKMKDFPSGLKDKLNYDVTGLVLQDPLGTYDAPNQDTLSRHQSPPSTATVKASQPDDPGLSANQPVANELAAEASMIRLSLNGGISFGKIPERGYARIESADPNNPNVKVFEIIYYYRKRQNHPTYGLCLEGVRRGLAFPETVGALAHPGGTTILFIEPSELPPLTIASPGLFTVEGGSSAVNKAGNQVAQQFRRLVAQALPQEELLELRWEKQAHNHALLVQRHGNLMSAFPHGYRRMVNEPPDDNILPVVSDLDKNVGVRPGILRSQITSTHFGRNRQFGREWTRTFSQERLATDDPFAQGTHEYSPTTSHNWRTDLTPEGLNITNGPIGYNANVGASGIFSFQQTANNPYPVINGRMFGFWVKPTQRPTGTITLFDIRAPQANVGERFAPANNNITFTPQLTEPGDNYYQNRITLTYVEKVKQLVLTIANSAVEHLNDHGPIVAGEDFSLIALGEFPPSDTLAPYVDPRCLGSFSYPGILKGIHPLAPKRPLNFVQHRYQLDQNDGLKENMWHYIQVGFVGNDPGHMSIVVNGIAGKDISRTGTAMGQMRDVGDHMTVPAMTLQTPLPGTSISTTGSKSGLYVPSITLDAITYDPDTDLFITGAQALEKILPKRGTIRIGNEFISYEDLLGNQIKHCVRARRQDSYVNSTNPKDLWVYLEEHLANDPVYPGGIRITPNNSNHLWDGETKLVNELPNGDKDNYYRVWVNTNKPPHVDIPSSIPIILPADTQILLANDSPVIDQLPPRGFARIDWSSVTRSGVTIPGGSEIIYYDNGSRPTTVLNNVVRGLFGTTAATIPYDDNKLTRADVPHLYILSFEVDSNPIGSFPDFIPTIPNVPPPVQVPRLAQICDPTTHRVEWINYTHLSAMNGKFFFVDLRNEFGFDYTKRIGSRARCRTAFAGTDLPSGNLLFFPAGSQVLPVQTNLGPGHVLVTGDMFTLLPLQPGTPSKQVGIRYACTDGFHQTAGTRSPSAMSWDTINHYFTFTEKLNQKWNNNAYELVAWPGWSGQDLTRGDNIMNRNASYLPQSTLPHALEFSGNNIAYFGGEDPNHPFLRAVQRSKANVVIDSLYAGQQPGGINNNTPKDNVVESYGGNNTANAVYLEDPNTGNKFVTWLPASTLPNNFYIKVSNNIFPHATDFGFLDINGEVFAFEHEPGTSGNAVKLIARGLFGSQPIEHRGPEPVMYLPIGPVYMLDKPLANNIQEVDISPHSKKRAVPYTNIDPSAPALMLLDLQTQKMELITIPDRYSTPWLRGMYNTMPQGNWQAQNGNTGTLVIGWWPRYPSGHPHSSSPVWSGSPQQKDIILRNRMYSWMSYPIRFYDTYLTNGSGLADITLLSDGEGTYNVSVMALDQGFEWSTSMNNAMPLTPGTAPTDVSAIFSRYNQRAVDGVEMRVRFEYAKPPSQVTSVTNGGVAQFLHEIARNGNTAPMIGKVKLRARAPTKIIQVEESR
jgi:hypothetical protein